MSALPKSEGNAERSTKQAGVELVSQSVYIGPTPAFARTDVYAMLSLLALAPVAMCVRERRWPAVCRALARLSLAGRASRWRRRQALAGLRLAFADHCRAAEFSYEHVCTELEANRLELRLQILRGLMYPHWRPDVRVEGVCHVEAALAAGRGAILWISRFAFADTLAKMGLKCTGYPPVHLSRSIHGFSHSSFGRRWLNPLQQRVEDRSLEERVVLNDSAPSTAMRRLQKALAQNRIVSITVDSWGAHAAETPFLCGRIRVATGAPSLAWKTGARLIPVFVAREATTGAFRILIDEPLIVDQSISKSAAQQAAVAAYVSRLERHVTPVPGQWRDWSKVRPGS
jgi:lauroyl/myristoyl acyltransferase